MFDIGFSELIVIALVALVVIGPERLPRVARTVGALLGRAQRYVNDVKADIEREVNLDELKNLKSTFEEAAKSVEQSVHQAGQELQATADSLNQSISATAEAKAEPAAEQHLAAEEHTAAEQHMAVEQHTAAEERPAAGENPAVSAQLDLGLESTKPAHEQAAAPKA